MKRCAKCLQELPLSSFQRKNDRHRPHSTHQSACKDCRRRPGARVRHKDMATRFWSLVTKDPEGCWLWHGTFFKNSYGRFHFHGQYHRAHRLSYEWHVGPIPDGLFVLHHCDTPACVRPDHLFLGSSADNSRDACIKGRRARKLTADQVQDIRQQHAMGKNFTALAHTYNVSVPTIWTIVKRTTWTHIE